MTTTHMLETAEARIAYDVHGPLPAADGRPPLFMIGQPMDASGRRPCFRATTAASSAAIPGTPASPRLSRANCETSSATTTDAARPSGSGYRVSAGVPGLEGPPVTLRAGVHGSAEVLAQVGCCREPACLRH